MPDATSNRERRRVVLTGAAGRIGRATQTDADGVEALDVTDLDAWDQAA